MKKAIHPSAGAQDVRALQRCSGGSSRFVRTAVAGAVLAAMSTPGFAILRDHGPGDPVIKFPLWYRDFNGMALGHCRSVAASPSVPGSPMCFPLVPEAAPPSFAGNLGPELFYQDLNVDVVSGGIDLRYVTALESAYGTPNPLGAARLGQEMVFARIRFTMHVLAAECAGNYRIIHPFGDEEFVNVPQGKRALFSTLDIPLGAIGDFEGALNGSIGPFLRWEDENLGNEIPMPTTDGKLSVGTEQFVGDPNVPHTFTGSPFIEYNVKGDPASGAKYQLGGGQPAHQNYVKVIAPAGCDIGGDPNGEGINVFKQSLGLLLGQVWTAPIATPTTIRGASFSRTQAGVTALDVWVESAPAQEILLSATGISGAKVTEDINADGTPTGAYHAHLVFNGAPPSDVSATNTTSNPDVTVTSKVSDVVTITSASSVENPPGTYNVCLTAHSSDQFGRFDVPAPTSPGLTAEVGPLTGSFLVGTPTTAQCGINALPDPTDLLYVGQLPNGTPPVTEVLQTATVVSAAGGRHTEPFSIQSGDSDSTVTLTANNDAYPDAAVATITSASPATLPVGANDNTAAGTAPYAIVVVQQPLKGTVTDAGAGNVTFAPIAGSSGTDSFTYVQKDANGQVSNQARVDLNITFNATAPATVGDNFAVFRSNTKPGYYNAKVLANDTAGSGTTLDPASVTIVTQPTRGTATVLADGSITYRPNANTTVLASDFFTYTVKGKTVDGVRSAASTEGRVDIVLEPVDEALTGLSAKYQNSRYDIRFSESTNWSGTVTPAAGNGASVNLTPSGWCYLIQNNGVTLKAPYQLIGTAQVVAGTVQMQPLSGNGVPTATGSFGVRCRTSNAVNTDSLGVPLTDPSTLSPSISTTNQTAK